MKPLESSLRGGFLRRVRARARPVAAWSCSAAGVALAAVLAARSSPLASDSALGAAASAPERFAPLDLGPRRLPLLDIPDDVWERSMEAFRPRGDGAARELATPSVYLHYLRLEPLLAQGSAGPLDEPEEIVSLLLDDAAAEREFGSPTLVRTRQGARFRTPPVLAELRSRADENHPDQNLSVLAERGVPLTRAMSIGGTACDLGLVLDDLLANFSFADAEFEWTALSLCFYLPPRREWTDRFGTRWTFDDVARRLLEADLERRPCGGAHVLQAMVLLSRADRLEPVLGATLRAELDRRLAELVERLRRRQHPDGSWGAHWHADADRGPSALDARAHTRLLVTGHLTEVALYLPEDLQLDVGTLQRGGAWLWSRLRAFEGDELELLEDYCPWTHAARAVGLLRRPPPQAQQVAPTCVFRSQASHPDTKESIMKAMLGIVLTAAVAASAYGLSDRGSGGRPVADADAARLFGGGCNIDVEANCGVNDTVEGCEATYAKGLGPKINGVCFKVRDTIQCSTDGSTGCGAVYVLGACKYAEPGEL